MNKEKKQIIINLIKEKRRIKKELSEIDNYSDKIKLVKELYERDRDAK